MNRIGAVIVATAFGPFAATLVGALAGITSVRGLKKSGVYANGRTAVIRGRLIEDTGVYELYFHELEITSETESDIEVPLINNQTPAQPVITPVHEI